MKLEVMFFNVGEGKNVDLSHKILNVKRLKCE
jgi:hypothetical protein